MDNIYSAYHYSCKTKADREAAEQAANSAIEAKDLANEAVTKLGDFDSTVDTAKTEIASLSAAEQAVIVSVASGVKDVAVSEINSTKDTAVNTVEQAGAAISSYQFPIVAISETSGNVSVETNTIYQISIEDAITFILPTDINTNVFNQIKVMMRVTGTPAIDWGTIYFSNKATPEIEEGSYDVYFDYDNLLGGWVCIVMAKGAAE